MNKIEDLNTFLDTEKVKSQMKALYGNENSVLVSQKIRYLHLADLFRTRFPDSGSIRIFSTSGRTEIAGNHTDHQRGHVLCASVDLDIIAVAAPNNNNVIRLMSEGYDKIDIIDLSMLSPIEEESYHSSSLIRGIASQLADRGYLIGGFDAYTSSHVPKGSGLSSSAAFEIMIATIINFLYNNGDITPMTMAIVSQYAENNFFGKPSGLMDQCGCSFGGLMTIDFKSPGAPVVESIYTDFENYGYSLIISNIGGSHADLNEDYASITSDMKKVAEYFGKTVLRDVEMAEFFGSLPSLRQTVSDKAILRAMHYFADDEKVILQADALKKNDIGTFLQLVNESGISSWTCLQNIYSLKFPEEQPIALGLALSNHILDGRGACRVHGGGFAGTIQAFVPHDLVDEYITRMEAVFGTDASWKLRIRNMPTTELAV
ncbi:MAG: galactokinase [Saccharofermentanales bacterium]